MKVLDEVLGTVSGFLAARTSRRGFLARTAVVGSALSVGPWGFLTRPQTAYAAVCGIDSTCSSGYTVFCATVNNGVNRCPPGSLVGGWWKSDGSGFCCGGARYYIDCHSYCSCGCDGRRKFCGEGCRNCSCGCGPAGQCDQRKVCCNEFRYGQCNQDVGCTGPVWCRVVTCTPPWRIPAWNCTTTSATDQRTNSHSAPSLQDCTPIGREYTAIGGPGSVLGEQRTPELGTPARSGTYQLFDSGSIYHSPATGAHEVHGTIGEKFAQLGWEAGPLGYPTTDELATPDGRGRFNHFERGSVYWSPDSGTAAVLGAIRETWRALGWEAGPLGYPVTDELATPDGRGRFNHFTGPQGEESASVYWTEQTGAHAVLGQIRDTWRATGWEAGPLGYPVTSELRTPDGVGSYNHFEHGSVYLSPRTGACAVLGAIRGVWSAWGWEAGPLGYPSTDERATPDGRGRYNHFTGADDEGASVYWSRETGAHAVLGAIRDAWAYLGWEAGRLGYPTSSRQRTPDGRAAYNHFQGGSVYSSADTGTHAVLGAVLDLWRAGGWETGPLGLPTTDEAAVSGGSFQNFEDGSVYVSASTGAHTVSGPVREAFRTEGGPRAWGFPTAEPEPQRDGQVRQSFQRGTAVLDVDSGRVTFG
ncbi:LGFP repeat-containing protein [Kineococcus sp. SYSU DK003]|uniref:LGFP repeat-containing protein n=1 Tax=Kineococcus sp. SYSU DK003 TaxID=3383124 RepID=UPI003D7D5BC3